MRITSREGSVGFGADFLLRPLANLQGALGKVSGRSYKAAPRQLLQVDASATSREAGEDAAKEAAKQGREALGGGAVNVSITRDIRPPDVY